MLLQRPLMEKVSVVIMNHAVAAQSFQYFDHADWLADSRIELLLAESEDEVQVPFAAVPSCLQLASDAAARLRDLVFLELATPFMEEKQTAKQSLLQQRLQENMSLLCSDGDVAELFASRQGERVLVAGAGPTLSTHYQWLAAQAGQHLLIAVDAALQPLVANGVYPDIVVSIEDSPGALKFFEEVELPTVSCRLLVYFPWVHPDILNIWPGLRLAAYPDAFQCEEVCKKHPKGSLFSSGTVSHPAVDLAVKMGAAEVVLLGMDFSFPGGKSHVEGSSFISGRDEQSNDHWILDGHGSRVATASNYRGFLRDLERYIALHPQVKFLNGSKQGARIEGTSYIEGDWR